MMAHQRSLERMQTREEAGGAGTGDVEQPQEEQPEQVAAEHGPAVETHTMHDHEGGVHHVHSLHPDGHEHHSQHGSAEEAHEHAKKLSGGGEQESPEDDEGGETEEEPDYE